MPAATSVREAFTIHPWETAHRLWSGTKGNIKTSSKVTNFVWSTINFSQQISSKVPPLPELKMACDVVKLFGKLTDSDNLAWNIANGSIFRPGPGASGPANNIGINNLVYGVKIGTLTLATTIQTYQTAAKYIYPNLSKVGTALTANVQAPFAAQAGKIALKIGGQRLSLIARGACSASAATIKNVSIIGFLAIDGYQFWCKISIARSKGETAEQVLQEIKTFENLAKIGCIVLVLLGAPTIVVAGTGLAVAFICIVSENQKIRIEEDKKK